MTYGLGCAETSNAKLQVIAYSQMQHNIALLSHLCCRSRMYAVGSNRGKLGADCGRFSSGCAAGYQSTYFMYQMITSNQKEYRKEDLLMQLRPATRYVKNCF